MKIISLAALFCLMWNSIYAQNYQSVTAESGDGIYSLLRRNGLDPSEYLAAFIELNSQHLGPNNSLIAGRKYKLPLKKSASSTPAASTRSPVVSTPKKTVRYEIFGPQYQDVALIDNQLKGTVYYLISGHGGPDPGAIGHYNGSALCEDEYAYDVTLRLARCLLEHGAQVFMIVRDPKNGIRDESILKPDKNEVCYPKQVIPLNQVARLRQRKDIVNKLYEQNRGAYQRLIEIHLDSRSKGTNIDVFFYYRGDSSEGRRLALTMQRTFKQKYDRHQPERGYTGTVSERNLYVLKNAMPTSVFIELGNINHERDQKRFMLADNRQALANWLCESVIKDFTSRRK
ncbi:MAG: N-acetylmuramoyl-L-alanine amidase [Bacteroidales bacterium]|jgi:N-acetylmuramoyl-L-alanine amidase|nr:N-acetylmuramoyl-L-alanine amidase [Bacteroidales bacterium]